MMNSLKYFFRRLLLRLFSIIPLRKIEPSQQSIDVIIPVVEKDMKILPLCIEGVIRYTNNKIQDIYIVAPQSDVIECFCREYGYKFVNEESVLGFGPQSLNLIIQTGHDRSGWLFQQLIKLSGAIGKCDNYLCIDADHILIKSHVFLAADEKPVFYMSSEMHIPYYNMIKSISSVRSFSLLSYVSHKMLFNKMQLKSLHSEIEKRTGRIWYQGIVELYDRNEESGFSEFELYGNYVKIKHIRPWKQQMLKYEELKKYDMLVDSFCSKYNCLTFPEYANQ